MHFDFTETDGALRYKLMSSAIVPRPIAWVTSCSRRGERNAAPFSFFNMMGAAPPLVVLGIMRRSDGSYKDSAANILETGEFVVNLVTESDAGRMNATSRDAPAGHDELAASHIPVIESTGIAPPRIASAPIAMECMLDHVYEAGRSSVLIGEVKHFHIADAFLDRETMRLDTPAMNLVARLHGADWYVRTTDMFALKRPK